MHIFWSLVESLGIIKKIREILLTEKGMVFLVLLYFHVEIKEIHKIKEDHMKEAIIKASRNLFEQITTMILHQQINLKEIS